MTENSAKWLDIPSAEAQDHAEICAANEPAFAQSRLASAAISSALILASLVVAALLYWGK